MVAFLLALSLYGLTADRGAEGQDSGWQQYRILSGQIEHVRGLAVVHPLHYYLGRLAIRLPLPPAFAITFVSVVFGALSVANIALLGYLLTLRLRDVVIPLLAFLLAHTFWQHSTHTESYAIVLGLLSAEWLCVAQYARSRRPGWLVTLFLVNGLGVSNHLLAGLATPVNLCLLIGAVRRGSLKWLTAAGVLLLWLAATMPFTALVVAEYAATHDLVGTLRSAFLAKYSVNVFNTTLRDRAIFLTVVFVFYNFPGLTVPLAGFGISQWPRLPRLVWRVLTAEFIIYGLFVVRYSITDNYTFFFPIYGLLTVFACVGLEAVGQWRPRMARVIWILAAIGALWPPLLYVGATRMMESMNAFRDLVGNKPYRNGYRTFLLPWGIAENHAELLNAELERLAPAGGLVLLEDHMQGFGIRFAQVAGQLSKELELIELKSDPPDLEGTVERYRQLGAPIILVPRDRDAPHGPLPDLRWRRVGDIYVLEG